MIYSETARFEGSSFVVILFDLMAEFNEQPDSSLPAKKVLPHLLVDALLNLIILDFVSFVAGFRDYIRYNVRTEKTENRLIEKEWYSNTIGTLFD